MIKVGFLFPLVAFAFLSVAVAVALALLTAFTVASDVLVEVLEELH